MYASPPARSALVAGHSASDAQLVRELLRRLGIPKVQTAGDGTQAVAMMLAGVPDLLVLDWNIQPIPVDMVVKAARERAEGSPRIVVTLAAPTRGVLAAAMDLKVESIVVKPFSCRTFMDRVPRGDSREEKSADTVKPAAAA